jgi:hypothetical protein
MYHKITGSACWEIWSHIIRSVDGFTTTLTPIFTKINRARSSESMKFQVFRLQLEIEPVISVDFQGSIIQWENEMDGH